MKCSKRSCKVNTGAGKGDAPRNCFSKKFKDNYDLINWGNKNKKASNQNKKQ
jgi:hypothetical protein